MARLSVGFVFGVLVLASVARADWIVTSSETERADLVGFEHRRVALAENGTDERATLELALFSTKSATLRVIDNPTGGDDLAAVMQRERCLAGVNGGYFDPANAPVGLLISDGKLVAPLQKARLLSGVVSVVKGRLQIQRAGAFSLKEKPSAARQCGPFLVEGGRPLTGLNNTRSARRTFVLVGEKGRAAIGYASSVTLAELGAVLATPGLTPDMKVQNALNLDGGSSSGFWFAGAEGAFSIRERKTVRDYIGIVAKP